MPSLEIPPLLSPIPSSVLWRYIRITHSNIDTDSPSEEPERPGHTHEANHTHGALPPFLRGIPIDWSEGHFTWQREGCDCTVKFCPQHCRELLGSNDDESEDLSTPAPGLRVDASDPYKHSSNDKAPDESSRHDVEDDDHSGDVDIYDADDEAGSGHSSEAAHDDGNDIQSARNEPRREGSSTLSAPAEEKTAQDDPEETISPGNRHEAEGMVCPNDRDRPSDIMCDSNETEVPNPELPQPRPQGLPRVQRPEQPPQPAELGIDAEYLEALPTELRDEVIADTQAKKATGTQRWQPQARGREHKQVSPKEVGESSANAEVFQEFLGALPEDLRNEILPLPPLQAPAPAPTPAPASTSPDPILLPVMSAATTTNRRPTYQTSRHLIREAGPLSQPQHFQRPRSGFLARVSNVSPSPAPGSTQVSGDGEGRVSGVNGRTPAQRNQSQSVPPTTGFFSTSIPKPVARKLFGRSDPSQPRPTPTRANDMAFGEANSAVDKVGEASGMVTRSQTLGRRRGQARNGVEVQQDIQRKEPSGSNKRGKKVEENREEAAEQGDEVEGKKKGTLGRAKRGRPKRSGSTETYGKRGKRRRRG